MKLVHSLFPHQVGKKTQHVPENILSQIIAMFSKNGKDADSKSPWEQSQMKKKHIWETVWSLWGCRWGKQCTLFWSKSCCFGGGGNKPRKGVFPSMNPSLHNWSLFLLNYEGFLFWKFVAFSQQETPKTETFETKFRQKNANTKKTLHFFIGIVSWPLH